MRTESSTTGLPGIVRAARLRLSAGMAAEAASFGAFVGGVCAAGVALVAVVGWLPAPGWSVLTLPIAGALGTLVPASLQPVSPARAALALDRRVRADESFVTALDDRAGRFRELAYARALAALGSRRVRDVLPIPMPRWLVAAVLATGLSAALVVIAGAEAVSRPPGALGDAADSASASASPDGAHSTADSATTESGSAVPSESGHAVVVPPSLPEETGHASSDDLRDVARDLAARGVDAGARALEALARGDVAEAERILREALGARGGAAGTAAAVASATTSTTSSPGAWSAGAWPLRYDRAIRAWLRVEAERSVESRDSGEPR